MEIGNSIKELQEELNSREALIEKLKETCINLKTQISTLRAAQIVLESRVRSASYVGQSLKDIILSEVERFGISTEDFVNDTYKGQNELIEHLIKYLVYGIMIPREFREEVCIRASNLFEIDYNVLMNSLEIPATSSIPETTKEPEEESKEKFIIPKDFGGLLKFNLKRLKLAREDFAKSLGVSSPTVSNWCGNKNVPRDPVEFSRKMVDKFFGSTYDEWYNSITVTKGILAKNKGAGH